MSVCACQCVIECVCIAMKYMTIAAFIDNCQRPQLIGDIEYGIFERILMSGLRSGITVTNGNHGMN